MSLVLPGDTVSLPSSSSLTLGPGLRASISRSIDPLDEPEYDEDQSIVATRLGLMGSAKDKGKGKAAGERIWVEGTSKRYIAAPKELVLGTVTARHADGYRVDIGTAQSASLDGLAFEGATKRSKPNLKIGTLVYARVSVASRDMEPELECVDATTGKAEGFGELKGGLMIHTSLEFARQLLTPKHPLLPLIAAQYPFEVAIGMNGRIWFKAAAVDQTIALKRVLEAAERGQLEYNLKAVGQMVKSMT